MEKGWTTINKYGFNSTISNLINILLNKLGNILGELNLMETCDCVRIKSERHANQFVLHVSMDNPQKPFTAFGDLEAALISKSILIQPTTLKPRPIDMKTRKEIPATLFVKGCNIGSMRPYLEKLKAAIGGNILVNAPKHYQVFDRITNHAPNRAEGPVDTHPSR